MLSPASSDGRPGKRGRKAKGRPTLQTHTHAKTLPKGGGEEVELSPEEAATDTYEGEQVTLDPFVREFLLLEVPMVVHSDLRSDPSAAIAPVPPGPGTSPDQGSPPDRPVDPRLAPLAQIRDRLAARKETK